MNRIIHSHLKSFVNQFSLEEDSESKQFEKFTIYSIITNRYNNNFDIDDIITGDDDNGIDGIAFVVNELVVSSIDELKQIFNSPRKNNDIEIIFIQAKTSDNFDLGDFLKFKEGVLTIISEKQALSSDYRIIESYKMLNCIIDNVTKIRNGKPSIVCRYVSTGIYNSPKQLEASKERFIKEIKDIDIFYEIDVKYIDRDSLTNLWVSTYSSTETSLPLYTYASLPIISGIEEAYLAVVNANDFVKNILSSDDGNLRGQVFEENVRSFLGYDNNVNKAISNTLASQTSSRFPVLNNGITIVSPDIQIQSNTIHLKNFQIVNGCQTSYILYENRHRLDNVMVTIKFVETQEDEVFSEIVKATNSQTKIEDNQFHSLHPLAKKIESFFKTYEGNECCLYFERREKQYVGKDITISRIFSLHNATRCFASMFCRHPELASRYTNLMYSSLAQRIFAEDNKEILFYAACITMYRFNLLIANHTLNKSLKKFKWHILPLVWVLINGKQNLNFNTKKIEERAQRVINIMSQHSKKSIDVFSKASDILSEFSSVTRDQLKNHSVLQKMLDKIE